MTEYGRETEVVETRTTDPYAPAGFGVGRT